ncbi:MAG: MBL fold metallo-hydrolase, partial [Dysgonamonadaceae bacterium]
GAIHNYNIATSVIQNCNFTKNEAKFGKDIANTLKCQVTILNNKNPDTDIYNDESSQVSENIIDTENLNSATQSKDLYSDDFNVTIIGSGNPQYNPERSSPSAMIQYKGITILIDMGNGTMAHLEELGLTRRKLPDALFLTHHHIDHNAEFIPMVHEELLAGKEFLIAGPSPIDEMTDYTKKFYKEDLAYRLSKTKKVFDENDTKETVKVLNGGESFEYKGIKISTIEVPHSIKTIAYRFDVDGKSIVITGDLSYTDQLQQLAKDVDVMVIDGKTASNKNGNESKNSAGRTETQNKLKDKSSSAHATINEIAKMAIECNAKTMVLTHLGSQKVDDKDTEELYSSLGFKGKVIIASDFLSVNPEGESYILKQKDTSSSAVSGMKRNASNKRSSKSNMQGNRSSGQKGNPMERFDTNGDLKISETEAKGPLKNNFSNIDTNNDGYITQDELQNNRGKR